VALAVAGVVWLVRGGHNGRIVDLDGQSVREWPLRIDPNTASWPELAALPGIGETLARRIVAHRQKSGPFSDVDMLQEVKGVGPKKLQEARPFLLVGQEK
jgi:competence protein ComEA